MTRGRLKAILAEATERGTPDEWPIQGPQDEPLLECEFTWGELRELLRHAYRTGDE